MSREGVIQAWKHTRNREGLMDRYKTGGGKNPVGGGAQGHHENPVSIFGNYRVK